MVDAAAVPETMAFREFADHLRCKPGYVTELRKAGRLVLTDDGKRVRVAESAALIADTRDPAKAGVAARHAATRAAAVPSPSTAKAAGQLPPSAAPSAADTPPSSFTPDDPHAKRRAKAMADKEEALARKALRDEQVELGQLLQREDVERAVADAATRLRTTLENVPATLAPELAATTDEGRCRLLLDNALEHVLEDLSRKFAALGRAGAAP